MNTVVKQIKRSFAVFSALFITVVTSRVRGHQHCGPEELVQCVKPLSQLSDSGPTFVSTKADLDRICPDLKRALSCIHSYTRVCMNLNHRRHFKKLFHGTGAMVHELCHNATYQEEYLKYAPCMKKVEPENEVCYNRYAEAMKEIQSKGSEQQNQQKQQQQQQQQQQNNTVVDEFSYQKKKREAADEGIKNICCSFKEYVECSTNTMKNACGEDAARFSREFMDNMSSALIKMHCSEFRASECGYRSGATKQSTTFAYSLLALAILTVMNFFFR